VCTETRKERDRILRRKKKGGEVVAVVGPGRKGEKMRKKRKRRDNILFCIGRRMDGEGENDAGLPKGCSALPRRGTSGVEKTSKKKKKKEEKKTFKKRNSKDVRRNRKQGEGGRRGLGYAVKRENGNEVWRSPNLHNYGVRGRKDKKEKFENMGEASRDEEGVTAHHSKERKKEKRRGPWKIRGKRGSNPLSYLGSGTKGEESSRSSPIKEQVADGRTGRKRGNHWQEIFKREKEGVKKEEVHFL